MEGRRADCGEQRDAFGFYTCLIDTIDTLLETHGMEKEFDRQFGGVFSDQMIGQGCPHRKEKEEAFHALNLPLRSDGLQAALKQFVKGTVFMLIYVTLMGRRTPRRGQCVPVRAVQREADDAQTDVYQIVAATALHSIEEIRARLGEG